MSNSTLTAAAPPTDSPVERLRANATRPPIFRHPIKFLWWLAESLFASTGLLFFLAILSAIPFLNFIALGYLLDAEARVGRSGRFRDAFPLRPFIPRIATAFLGIILISLPLWILTGVARDAAIIAPGSNVARRWEIAVGILTILAGIHLFASLAYGGTLISFFRPIRNARWLWKQIRQLTLFNTITDGTLEFLRELRPTYHFWLGLRAYVALFLCLVVPTFLFASLRKTEGLPGLIVITGGILLAFVLSWAPFLQARLAVENNWRSAFHLSTIRDLNRRAPWCWLLATLLTYALSIPLYFTTIILPPRDALWMVNLLFVICIYPARIVVGWAYSQSTRRERPAHFLWRWSASLSILALLGFYVFFLYFSQLIGQQGKLVLFEHPALLLPVPF